MKFELAVTVREQAGKGAARTMRQKRQSAGRPLWTGRVFTIDDRP